jgi:hypothetical protein
VSDPQRCPMLVRVVINAWIVLGLIAGFIGSKLVNKTGEGFFLVAIRRRTV